MKHRKRDVVLIKGSDGMTQDLFVEREPAGGGGGWRVAIAASSTQIVVKETVVDTPAKSRQVFREFCHSAVDLVLG